VLESYYTILYCLYSLGVLIFANLGNFRETREVAFYNSRKLCMQKLFPLTLLSAKYRTCTTWKHVSALRPEAKPQVREIEKL